MYKENTFEGILAGIFIIFVLIILGFVCWYSVKVNIPHNDGIPRPTATPKPSIIINDQVIDLDIQALHIVCDPSKQLGIAYFLVIKEDGVGGTRAKWAYAPSGILTDNDYTRFCGSIK